MDAEIPEPLEAVLLPLGEKGRAAVPSIEQDLRMARMDDDPDEYLAFALYKALQMGVGLGASAVAIGFILNLNLMKYLGAGIMVVITPLLFLSFGYQPKIKAKNISRNIEKNLPYALRHMLIEVSSGISLYQAMVSVSQDYEEASDEFERIVSDIQGGKSQIEAIEDSIARTESQMYRRTQWQLINSIKSGANVTRTLESLVDTILEEQKLEVQNYGEDLNPFILMYLMLAVIFPSLGVTLMIVLSSFTGFEIDQLIFYGIVGGLVVFQLFFLNLLKSRRPEVKAA
ncbi:MAG: type II secretion system F family protein [Candidatus Nanohaloarchaea archaeon]